MRAQLSQFSNETAPAGESARDHREGVIGCLGGGVRRTFSAAYLNEVANHPQVRPWLLGDGPLDLSATIANPENFAFEADGGGFIVAKLQEAIYEVHSLFLPDQRQHTASAMADGMDYMFIRTDCCRLVTRVPADNLPAAGLAKKGGFREWFRRSDVAYLTLDIDDWIQRNENLAVTGEWFHGELSAAKVYAGSGLPFHPDDGAHDRAVGASVEMFRAGNIGKALGCYNRWAAFAGYMQASLVSATPLTVDVGDAVVAMHDGNMEVLLCR